MKIIMLNIAFLATLFLFMMKIEQGTSIQMLWPSQCSSLDIPHARVRLRARGRLAKIRCYSGFTMIEGDRRLTCIRKQWLGRIPQCIKNGCKPVFLFNGDIMELYDGALLHITCNPGYSLVGSSAIFCDGLNWNDTLPVCQVPPPNPNHTSCTFETNMCGWNQDHMDDLDWKWTSASLNAFTGGLGAKFDHTFGTPAGHYIYTDSNENWNSNTIARLYSPILDMPVETPACMVFYYHIYGPNSGSFNVYVKPDHVPFELLVPYMSVSGFNADVWKMGFLELDSSLSDWFQVILEAQGGAAHVCDVAVDDFMVTSGDECIRLEIEYKVLNQPSSTTDVISTETSVTTDSTDSRTSTSLSSNQTLFSTEENSRTTLVSGYTTFKTTQPVSMTYKSSSSSTVPLPTTDRVMTSSHIFITTFPPTSSSKIFPIISSTPKIVIKSTIPIVSKTPETTLMQKTLTPFFTTSKTTRPTIDTRNPTNQYTESTKERSSSTIRSTRSFPWFRSTKTTSLPSTEKTTLLSSTQWLKYTTTLPRTSTRSHKTDSTISKSFLITESPKPVQQKGKNKTLNGHLMLTIFFISVAVLISGVILFYVYRRKRNQRILSEDADIRQMTEEAKEESCANNSDERPKLFINSYSLLQNSSCSPELNGTPV